ncbi:type II toxin-antitoxin system RelE/ParE family toxin [Wenzhouxiangella limi]|uniref:Type II toxin-antitoxin system RelE/ParE family toxin n=1 Tax=Wenzhouxiangella limi TaxID=2707351 RepID=A0A845UVT7_9GAMM|nr:type II toxin-antitoxin system RelE/ParE family toxin [Wenzhouxiangella limi]NDY95587.1 type II toxin-antitoxin system RelE/ParE family toxin [Wenzhouxiangella limi]
MAQLIYSRQALSDLDRRIDFLLETDPTAAVETAELISEAIQILGNHPLIGRVAELDMRELVISRGRTGYLALDIDEEAHDAVLILAIRHQREAGFVTE